MDGEDVVVVDMPVPAGSGKQIPIISFSLSHPLGKMGIKTVPGQPEIVRPLKLGPNGFCVADFGMGDEATECPNVLWNTKAAAKAAAKAKAKAKAKLKKAATAKAKGNGAERARTLQPR